MKSILPRPSSSLLILSSMAYTCSLSPSNVKIFVIWFGILYLLPAARAKSQERHRQRSRLAAAAKLFVGRSCFAAPFGESFSGPAGIAPAVPAGTAPDRASLCAVRQGSRTGSPTPAGAADCPKTALYQTGPFSAYPAWSATIDHCRGHTARQQRIFRIILKISAAAGAPMDVHTGCHPDSNVVFPEFSCARFSYLFNKRAVPSGGKERFARPCCRFDFALRLCAQACRPVAAWNSRPLQPFQPAEAACIRYVYIRLAGRIHIAA